MKNHISLRGRANVSHLTLSLLLSLLMKLGDEHTLRREKRGEREGGGRYEEEIHVSDEVLEWLFGVGGTSGGNQWSGENM